jgi:hypothetical protein
MFRYVPKLFPVLKNCFIRFPWAGVGGSGFLPEELFSGPGSDISVSARGKQEGKTLDQTI